MSRLQTSIVLPALLAIALATSTTRADHILGINSVAYGGGIYAIDVDTGIATLYASTASAALGSDVASGNGLASSDSGIQYFSSYGAGNSTLYTIKDGTTTASGSLVGTVGSGTYGQGGYWYISQSSPFLHLISFNGAGTYIISDTAITLSGAVKTWTFGDIALSGNTIYGAANTANGAELFSINLNTFSVTTIAALPLNLQIGFLGAQLIGLDSDTGRIYGVDTSTGVLTYKSIVTSATGETLRINDLGGTVAAVPEPMSLALTGLGLAAVASIRRLFSRAG